MAEPTKKKVVHVESSTPAASNGSNGAAPVAEPGWKPTPEAKGKATTYRIIAAVLWVLAIGGEAFAIFYLLKQTTVNMVFLIIAIVVIGLLAIGGSLLWKQANASVSCRAT